MSEGSAEFVDLSELRGRLAYDYPDVPPPALDDAIICGAQKLTQRPLLQVWCDLTRDLEDCQDHYSFERHLPDDMEMAGIGAVWFCGKCIPAIKDKCDLCSCGWRLCDEKSITLQPAVSGDVSKQTLKICINLRPRSDACKLPKVLVERYWKQIRDFARVELSLLPNQEWTNPQYARLMERRAMVDVRCIMGNIDNNGQQGQVKATSGRKWLLGSTKRRRSL